MKPLGWSRSAGRRLELPDPRTLPAPAPSKFSHVDLVVSDLDRSLEFYRGLLVPLDWTGLAVRRRLATALRNSRCGGVFLHS